MSLVANAGRRKDALHSDAPVVSGLIGYLTTTQIFPASYRIVKTGALDGAAGFDLLLSD